MFFPFSFWIVVRISCKVFHFPWNSTHSLFQMLFFDLELKNWIHVCLLSFAMIGSYSLS